MYVYAVIQAYGTMFARPVAVFLTAEEAIRHAIATGNGALTVAEIKQIDWQEFVIPREDWGTYGDVEAV